MLPCEHKIRRPRRAEFRQFPYIRKDYGMAGRHIEVDSILQPFNQYCFGSRCLFKGVLDIIRFSVLISGFPLAIFHPDPPALDFDNQKPAGMHDKEISLAVTVSISLPSLPRHGVQNRILVGKRGQRLIHFFLR